MPTYSATFDTRISNAEISTDPALGKVTGDNDPTTTQNGIVTKMSKSFDQIKEDLEDAANSIKVAFDGHNHNPGGSYPGGPPIGTGGVRAIKAGAVENAKIKDLNVTGAKLADGSVTSGKIADNTMDITKIGIPTSVNLTGGTDRIIKPAGVGYVIYHVEGSEFYTSFQTATQFVVTGGSVLRYYGGG